MRIFRGFDNLPTINRPCVTVGSFDGVHRGHRLLISQLDALASERDAESVVVTFDPHPRQLLRGENRLLSTLEEKLILLAETGVDNVIVVDFTHEFSRIIHTQFIEDYIIGKLHTRMMITGQEHHFGHNRSGNIDLPRQYGIETCRFERFDEISSTMIRQAIEKGEMNRASELLGGNGYLICAPVADSSKMLPPQGKYMVKIDSLTQKEMIITPKELSTKKGNIRIMFEI